MCLYVSSWRTLYSADPLTLLNSKYLVVKAFRLGVTDTYGMYGFYSCNVYMTFNVTVWLYCICLWKDQFIIIISNDVHEHGLFSSVRSAFWMVLNKIFLVLKEEHKYCRLINQTWWSTTYFFCNTVFNWANISVTHFLWKVNSLCALKVLWKVGVRLCHQLQS